MPKEPTNQPAMDQVCAAFKPQNIYEGIRFVTFQTSNRYNQIFPC